MVQAAQSYNPFAASADQTNCCTYMARWGVCLEPGMCFLFHKVQDSSAPQSTPPAMSTAAREFNPFAAGSASIQAKEFKPPVQEQESTAQAGIISMLSRMGLDAQVDSELGTIYIQQIESCDCCHGLINNCNGDMCEQLGMCYCISEKFHEAEDSD